MLAKRRPVSSRARVKVTRTSPAIAGVATADHPRPSFSSHFSRGKHFAGTNTGCAGGRGLARRRALGALAAGAAGRVFAVPLAVASAGAGAGVFARPLRRPFFGEAGLAPAF